MKKKTFYVLLAVWVLAVAVFAGVLISHFVGNNESTPAGAPGNNTEQGGGGSSNPNDDEGWTNNY